jgi:hypothetical protein
VQPFATASDAKAQLITALRFAPVSRSVERMEQPSVSAAITWTCFSNGSTFMGTSLLDTRRERATLLVGGLARSDSRGVMAPLGIGVSGGAAYCLVIYF